VQIDLNNSIPEYVKSVIYALESNGYEAHLVGGSVRDLLAKKLGVYDKEAKDYDVATNATPEQVKSVFSVVIPTGEKHGTVTVVVRNEGGLLSHPTEDYVEVTTYRADGEYSDGRRPDEIRFVSSLQEDLSRRDFTINAMAYRLDGTLVDPFDGLIDLQRRVISAVGYARLRFSEDALRMLRAIRFTSQLEFNLSSEVFSHLHLLAYKLEQISMERIRDEFVKIINSKNPLGGINALMDTGLMEYIIPELYETVDFDQHNPHHNRTVYEHLIDVLNGVLHVRNFSDKEIMQLRLAALLHDIAKPRTFSIGEDKVGHFYNHHMVGMVMAEVILRRLKFDGETIEVVPLLVKEHMTFFKDGKATRKSVLKKFINRVGEKNLPLLYFLQKSDSMSHVGGGQERVKTLSETYSEIERILTEKEPLSVRDLHVNGHDLTEIGIPAGKNMGTILKMLLDHILDNPQDNNQDKLIELSKKFYFAITEK